VAAGIAFLQYFKQWFQGNKPPKAALMRIVYRFSPPISSINPCKIANCPSRFPGGSSKLTTDTTTTELPASRNPRQNVSFAPATFPALVSRARRNTAPLATMLSTSSTEFGSPALLKLPKPDSVSKNRASCALCHRNSHDSWRFRLGQTFRISNHSAIAEQNERRLRAKFRQGRVDAKPLRSCDTHGGLCD